MRRGAIINSRVIGEKIKFRRQDIGMSQERLAELLGVTYQQVQRYESGKNRLNVESIQFVAQALSVPVAFFFSSVSSREGGAELAMPTVTTEERSLLRYFRETPGAAARKLIIQVARLARGR